VISEDLPYDGWSFCKTHRFAGSADGFAALNPSYELPRPSPPPRLKHLLPRLLHGPEPLCGNAGEFGDCVAAGMIVKDQAVADQAQRLHGLRGVAEGLLDVEQKRDQV
jgi:hypothetical protein